MTKIISMVEPLHLKGVINSVAKSFIITNDLSLLIKNGCYIALNHKWGHKVLYMMEQEDKKMYGWKATTKKYLSPLVY